MICTVSSENLQLLKKKSRLITDILLVHLMDYCLLTQLSEKSN